MTKKHVLGFSSNGGKLFAVIDEQGILRIWDTETNALRQEFTPGVQASGPCTALTWVSLGAERPKKSRKSQQISTATEKHYIALGTLKGKVVLYSLATGSVSNNMKIIGIKIFKLMCL